MIEMTELFHYMVSSDSWPTWHLKGESAMKRNIDHQQRGSPPKYKRVGEQPGLPRITPFGLLPHATHAYPMELMANTQADMDDNSHKCAGTQTPFSSFPAVCDKPPPAFCPSGVPATPPFSPWPPAAAAAVVPLDTRPPDDRVILDLDQYARARVAELWPAAGCPPAGCPPAPPPRPSSYPSAALEPTGDGNAPLNLTMSDSQTRQTRPSVITRAASFGGRDRPPPPSELAGHNGHMAAEAHRVAPQVASQTSPNSAVYKTAIEEHFQRSLGYKYAGYSSPGGEGVPREASSSPAAEPAPPPAGAAGATGLPKQPTVQIVSMMDTTAVSVTGCVDDHFEKSLGAAWSRLKARSEDAADPTPRSGSVDDHFMKALGDTWLKIKAEQVHGGGGGGGGAAMSVSSSSPSSSSSSPHPHQPSSVRS